MFYLTLSKHCNATCTNCGKGYVHRTENVRNKMANSLSNLYCYNCCKLFRKNRLSSSNQPSSTTSNPDENLILKNELTEATISIESNSSSNEHSASICYASKLNLSDVSI